jgi:predicted DNA-binding ribbon-helix-helix protein
MAGDLLAIYLNDHLAGSTVGTELAKRAQGENDGTPLGDFLADLTREIAADRAELERLMDELGVERSRVKSAGAYVIEKLGRLKVNGQLTGYSPLSRVVELEGLITGVSGKLSLWRTLLELAERDERLDAGELEVLAGRAEDQLLRLHALRGAAGLIAFVDDIA